MEIYTPEYINLEFFNQKFNAYSEFKNELDSWCNDNKVPIKIRSSQLIKDDCVLSKQIVYSKIYYTCVHYGIHKERLTTGSRPNQKVLATNCPFFLHYKYDTIDKKIYLFQKNIEHNHKIGPEIFCNYSKNRRLNESEQKELEKYFQVDPSMRKLKRHVILTTKKPITSDDLYNYKNNFLKKSTQYFDEEGVKLKKLIEEIKNEDSNNKVVCSLDENSNLNCLFIQTSFQMEWFKNYNSVVHLDGTFKLNCENYLLYVLMVQDGNGNGRPIAYCFMKNETLENLEFFYNTFVEFNEVGSVKIIIVDKDLTNLQLIGQYFPNANILLCVFHVIKYLKTQVAKLVIDKISKNELMETIQGMVYASDELEYNEFYDELGQSAKSLKQNDFKSYFDKNWNSCQNLWVRHFRLKLPHMNTQTNNHLESFNSNLKISIKCNKHLTESIIELMAISREYLFNQLSKNLQDIKKRKTILSNSDKINSLLDQLDDKAAELVLNQFNLMKKQNFCLNRSGESDYKIETKKNSYLIMVDSNKEVKCECDFTRNFMLPCRHTLYTCESNRPLVPWFHKRFLKKSLLLTVNPVSDFICSQQTNSNSPTIWKWSKDCLRASTPQEKFHKIKNLCEEITNLVCSAGENEFLSQKSQLESYLKSLQTNNVQNSQNSQPFSSQAPCLNTSTPKSRRTLDFSDVYTSINPVSDELEILTEQPDMCELSPKIIVNKVLNRVGRPAGTNKKFGYFNINKRKTQPAGETPISKRTRSKKF